MKITFIGTSHGAPEKNRGCTAMLIEVNDVFYVIDTGSSVEKYMVDHDLDIEKIKAVFITHMHEDHVGALTGLLKMMKTYHGDMRAKIFLPEEQGIQALRAWFNGLHFGNWPENRLPLLTVSEGEVYSDENIKVSAVKTDHMSGVDTFAYIVDCEGKRVIFTGDLTYDLHDFPKIIIDEKSDAVVAELCHYHKSFGFIPGTIDLLKSSQTEKMIFGHIYPGGDTDMEEIKDTFPFEVHIAADGNTYSL